MENPIFIGNNGWKDEPRAVLQYGKIKVELPLTYIHHLCNIFHAKNNDFFRVDCDFFKMINEIENQMWSDVRVT